MRIGLSSLIGEGFGSGSFTFGEVPSGGGIPPAGTILYTHTGYEYPISEGGAYVSINASNYPTQVGDVYEKADGSGGSYYDWVNVFNVQYKSYGTLITSNVLVPSYINLFGTNYQNGTYTDSYRSDGAGSYYQTTEDLFYYSGALIVTIDNMEEVPVGSNSFYADGTYVNYFHDGGGGYTSSAGGAYYSWGNYITNYSGTDYYWDGYGGYYY